MGTRANIGIRYPDGKGKTIYTHWHGYPSHMGKTLLVSYPDQSIAEALIAPGDLSSIGASIGAKHDFDGDHEGVCNYYGRDRGETGVEPVETDDFSALLQDPEWRNEYLYVFDVASQSWFWAKGRSGSLIPLTLKDCTEDEEEDES